MGETGDYARRIHEESASAGVKLPVTQSPLSQSLSSDLLASGRRRLGWFGLLAAASVILMHAVYRIYFPSDLNALPTGTQIVLEGCVALLFFSSLGIWWLCRSRSVPHQVALSLGVVYMVVGAWILTLLNTAPKLGNGVVGANGFADAWIVAMALTIPVRPWKVAIGCAVSVLALPASVALNQRIWSAAAPPMELVILSVLSTIVTAGIAVFLSSLNYRLRAELTEAKRLGAYQLLERIGRGGMGEVWLARHSLLASAAAVKIIRSDSLRTGSSANDAPVLRFEREARATAGLRSPHTVAVYDFGATADGQLYYAMEYLEGIDMRELVKRFGPIPASRAIYLLSQVCDSLREAHRHGIVHRDIKPSNLFLCRLGDNYDFVKVLDFGLAKDISASAESNDLTQEGSTTGTPAFMAPEMALGSSRPQATTDIYSLGCVAYWLVTGEDVFKGPSPMAVLICHARETPIPPSKRSENPVPADLEALILRCLEKNPNDRPQTAGEFLRALNALEAAAEWNNDDAERWWKLHLPEMKPHTVVIEAEHAPTMLIDRKAAGPSAKK